MWGGLARPQQASFSSSGTQPCFAEMKDRRVCGAQVAQSAFLDLMLLSRGHYFVGSFGGHMTRLAFELMVARRGRVVPYISVDRCRACGEIEAS